MPQKRKKVLFVDDDAKLLELIRQLMSFLSQDSWEIFTAPDVSRALRLLQDQRVDLLVIDIHMPVVDGLQFLNLLQRKYPNLLKVVLTGDATEEYRARCLNNGAELFLEKPREEGGWRTIHATLHELARFQPEEGFRGVLRRVGLADVLQMECLARHSVVLNVSTGSTHGTVFVKDGQIIHAQCGGRVGEEAFNYLLSLGGGEFDVQPYAEPPKRSIEGSWEFLLMEAARRRDEASESTPPPTPSAVQTESVFSSPPSAFPPVERLTEPVVPVIQTAPEEPGIQDQNPPPGGHSTDAFRPQVEEMLVCSLQGEVLHEWKCANPNNRVGLLEFISQKARQLAQGLPLGEFERLEISGPQTRAVAQIQDDRALFVRTSRVPVEGEANSFGA
jgi:CheY-like chemotaxis protein